MTTAQYAQAIDEAYQAYVKLFYSDASQTEQDAQFETYRQAVLFAGLQQAWNALQAVPAYTERKQS